MNPPRNDPPAAGTRHLDGPGLARVLAAGGRHLFSRREYINRINVFPVPDSDTGTNMAFTFKAILDALGAPGRQSLPEVLERIARAAVDGARGNSGAIMAQYFQGCREFSGERTGLDALGLALACQRGATQAWTAMAEPVQGTLPTVLEAFGDGLLEEARGGEHELRPVFEAGLAAARDALARTPDQLPVLRQAGVVDAGGQGFVDLLEGMATFLESGTIDPLDEEWVAAAEAEPGPDAGEYDVGDHQFCTECVVEGEGIDRLAVMDALKALDHSSMVVAGGAERVRVHIHVNNPAEVFLACEPFGEISRQKAEDMQWQHGLLGLKGEVAVVTDSGGDLPDSEVERLAIHVVPVRLSFGDREYLDGVSLQPADFYRMLADADEPPRTSQPPARDFRRVYELLTVHGYRVFHVGLSTKLSGTTQAARTAAEEAGADSVRIFDTLNASCGQGLLALAAAEAAAEGRNLDEIESLLGRLAPLTVTLAMPDELDSAIRGGRVPAWVGRLAKWLRVTPVLTNREGRLVLAGIGTGRGLQPDKLVRRILKAMDTNTTYRIMVSHADNPDAARAVRRGLLGGHPRIHSCFIAEAGPALGVHLGRGGLIAGFMPDPHSLD